MFPVDGFDDMAPHLPAGIFSPVKNGAKALVALSATPSAFSPLAGRRCRQADEGHLSLEFLADAVHFLDFSCYRNTCLAKVTPAALTRNLLAIAAISAYAETVKLKIPARSRPLYK
jgi:hypothetical protein